MRYEFEVGDYVKIIANQFNSEHPIGYIGKIIEVKEFPYARLSSIWYLIDKNSEAWSYNKEVVSATKAEYDVYHQPKLPGYVKCIRAYGNAIKGKIYNTSDEKMGIHISNGLTWNQVLIEFKCLGSNKYFVSSTKEAFDAQNKPKPKFKIGDKVKLVSKRISSAFNIGDILIIESMEYNTYHKQMMYNTIKVKDGTQYQLEEELVLYAEPQFKVGDWVVTVNTVTPGVYKYLAGEVFKITNISGVNVFFDALGAVTIDRLRLATDVEIKEHLLAEASRRGFKPGVIYNLSDVNNTAQINPELFSNGLSRFNLHCGYGCGLIYNDATNKWATIVPNEKKLCGHTVDNNAKGSLIRIGCKTISRDEVQGFLNVCDKFDIRSVNTSYYSEPVSLFDIKEALK